MITRPLLAASYRDTSDLPCFPLLVTPKIDGVRALMVNGCLVSRSFNPIPNDAVRQALERLLPDGADGEVTCGDLYSTTSVVMSKDAPATDIVFHWFDWAYDVDAPYEARVLAIKDYVGARDLPSCIKPLIPVEVNDADQLLAINTVVLNERYEGLVIRIPSGRYKCGRSTIAEGLMIKMKPHDDCEAEIVGTEELMRNTNVMHRDNFGRAKRSSSNSGLIGGDTLGAIVAITPNGDVFKVGTGFTNEQRRELWRSRDSLVGCLVKYKCETAHSRMVPRSPVFIGIRHKDDVN